ncbi:MAG: hypothetical protein RL538_387 [Candidatus Parcubacteria bacterium]|jgi:transcriptional regulator with XRE-family HTH domain
MGHTTYGDFIRAQREQRGLSQQHIADELGVSRSTYLAIEKGTKELSLSEAEKLSRFFGITIDELLQNQIPDIEKYKQMIHAFLRQDGRFTKTKLAKLLYFADFAWFYKNLKSMSGMSYRKIKYGPVADAYFRVIDEMFDSGEINIENTDDGAMLISETRSGTKTRLSSIKVEEKKLIEKIAKKWGHKRTGEVVDFTHKQLPYMFAEENEIVSYEIFGQENPDEIY